jgi:glucuronate isomerase
VPSPLRLDPDRLFPANPEVRATARRLYETVAGLPILSPHGHTDPSWFAGNENFANPAALFIGPDHYVYRMLYSQGISLERLGIAGIDGQRPEVDPRDAWALFATNYHLFRGTPSRMWLDWVFSSVFGLDVRLSADTAGLYYDTIDAALATDAFRPRALFERYNIEVIATTESPIDTLEHHAAIRASGWHGRVITAYRPDPVVDPEFEGFADNLREFARLSGEDTSMRPKPKPCSRA